MFLLRTFWHYPPALLAIICPENMARFRPSSTILGAVLSVLASLLGAAGAGLPSLSDGGWFASTTGRVTDEQELPPTTPIIVFEAATYPVCNGPDARFHPMFDMWISSIRPVCDELVPRLSLACNLAEHLCCREPAPPSHPTSITCNLQTGLCTVHDEKAGMSLVGAWKCTQCGAGGFLERFGRSLTRFCRCSPVVAVTGDFPTPPCIVVHKEGATNTSTGLTNATTTSFGPYALRPHGPAGTNKVADLEICVPDQPVSVRTCDAAVMERVRTAVATCTEAAKARLPVDGSPGQCCTAGLRGSGGSVTSLITCLIGGACVRVDFTHDMVLVDDFRAATGCLVPSEAGNTVVPPGSTASASCTCAPGNTTGLSGCVFPRRGIVPEGCLVADRAQGSLLGSSTVKFTPVLNQCST